MAKVIDKLRVQGNPAPRNLATHPDSGVRRPEKSRWGGEGEEVAPEQQTAHFVLSHAHLQPPNRDSSSGRSLSSAERRLQHLQRVQQANQGLSSMDLRQPDLPGKQFMLRGKPASAEVALVNRQRALLGQGSASTQSSRFGAVNTRESRRGQYRPGKALSEPPNGLLHERRAEVSSGKSVTADTTYSQPASHPHPHPHPNPHPHPYTHPSTASSYFVLAAPQTIARHSRRSAPPQHVTHGMYRQWGDKPQTAQGIDGRSCLPGRAGLSSHDGGGQGFQLTGHQVLTPRSNQGMDELLSSRDGNQPRSPRGTSRSSMREYWTAILKERRSPGLKDNSADMADVNHNMLQQCLHVQQSTQGQGQHDTGEAIKMKHFTQYVRGEALQSGRGDGKVNYNNPYRQVRHKERRVLPESAQRYIFDSVASYIHFNKIYPQGKDNAGKGSSTGLLNGTIIGGQPIGGGFKMGQPRVPHLAGFPKHCTDTILLRMMFEMNRPGAIQGVGLGHQPAGAPSLKSSVSNKYSDVARHKDLDEFLVTSRSPPTSRRTQRQQKQQNPNSNRSGIGNSSPPKEEDEEEKKNECGRENQNARKGDIQKEITGDNPGGISETTKGGNEQIGEEDEAGFSTLRTGTTTARDYAGDDADDEEEDDDSVDESVWNNNNNNNDKVNANGKENDMEHENGNANNDEIKEDS